MLNQYTTRAATTRALQITALTLGLVGLLAGPADARHNNRPTPGERATCQAACKDLRNDCGRGCRAESIDCIRPAKEETRACFAVCGEDFEAESVELGECRDSCVAEILNPVRTECRASRKECRSICYPGTCRQDCRGDATPPSTCKSECALELRECAKAGRAELRGCIGEAGCRVLEGEEREDCVAACVEPARENHAACKTTFQECAEVCDVDTTE
ncbi:MAG: hypothetical protein ACI91F_003615 [Candidatus Binatia bacterium]|jgi:hypothetical protein